jgi:hypothetical protein
MTNSIKIPKAEVLSEAENRLLSENQRFREQNELIRSILNKRSNTEQLSFKGAIETILDERDRAEKSIYLLKQELKRLNSLLLNKELSVQASRDFLDNLIRHFDKLYGPKQ